MSALPLLLRRSLATAAKKPSLTPAPSISPPVSSLQAGASLSHINYFKNRQGPIALADDEYPSWLWRSLDTLSSSSSTAGGDGEDVGDLYSKSKKSRALAKKRAAKLAALEAANPEKRVPITEQTVDLPYATGGGEGRRRVVAAVGPLKGGKSTVEIGGGVEVTERMARQAREELKREMRKMGRAKIKEANFLAQM